MTRTDMFPPAAMNQARLFALTDALDDVGGQFSWELTSGIAQSATDHRPAAVRRNPRQRPRLVRSSTIERRVRRQATLMLRSTLV